MDYMTLFDISAAGMATEKLRMEVIAMNLANTHTTRSADGSLYQPLRVVSPAAVQFESIMAGGLRPGGGEHLAVKATDAPPRLVYDPQHPAANNQGYVEYPNVDPLSEMLNMMETLRSYEANVKAMNAAKVMAQKAVDIGSAK